MKYSLQLFRLSAFIAIVLTAVACDCADPERKCIIPAEAKDHVGEEVSVEMAVQFGHELPGSKCCFLDSEMSFSDPNDLIIFITDEGMEDFKTKNAIEHPDRHFLFHRICVTGAITLYKKKPEIKVTSADQITDLGAPKLITAPEASSYFGKNVTVEFTVLSSNELANNCCVLNSDEKLDGSDSFNIFINMTGLQKFRANSLTSKPADYFLHKTIRVTGAMTQYQRRPQIKVNSPDQIKLVEDEK